MTDFAQRIELQMAAPKALDDLVPLTTFSTAVDSLRALLERVTHDRWERPQIDWFVRELRTGRVTVVIEGVATTTDDSSAVGAIIQTIIEAFEVLERGGSVREYLSFAALEQVCAIATLATSGACDIVVRGCGRSIAMSNSGADAARALVNRRYRGFGSVEGIIETVSIRGAVRSFGVAHALDGFVITCWSDATLLDRAKAALGARVRVTGEIVRRGDGRAESVQVSDLRVLRQSEELPPVNEIRGILADRSGAVVALSVDQRRHG